MKIKEVLLSLTLTATLLAGCTPKTTQTPTPAPTPAPAQTQQPKSDAVSTASIVGNQPAFLKAVSKEGTWIIAILNDMTIDRDIVLEGKFENKGAIARKLALYTQDDKKNVTARFTLKAPKLIVRSENARIQSGTFVGDVYVEANGFLLVDAKVDGNVYFANEGFKATYKIDEKSSVTKATEVKALK